MIKTLTNIKLYPATDNWIIDPFEKELTFESVTVNVFRIASSNQYWVIYNGKKYIALT